jgi:hypothetical protein
MKDSKEFNETKLKSVIIDGNLHSRFKMLCKGKSLKIGGVIEDLIRFYLHNPKKVQSLIEESKDNSITSMTSSK